MERLRDLKRGLWGFVILITMVFYSGLSAGDVIVSWDPNSEVDLSGYKLYYGTSSRNYSTILDVGNITEYTVTDLTDGNEYYFAVTAYDTAQNESEYSVEVSTVVGDVDNTAPAIPTIVNHSIDVRKVTIYWQANTEDDLAGYRVYYGSASGNYSNDVNVGNTTNFQTPDLTEGATYYFVVVAYDNNDNVSNYSNELSVRVPVYDHTAPSKPVIVNHRLDGNKINLSWSQNSEGDIDGYKVHFGKNSRNYETTIDVNLATSYTTPELDNGSTYYLAVTAYDTAQNESEYSDEITMLVSSIDKTPPAVPVVSNYEIQDRKVQISWKAVTAADLSGYKVYYGTESGNYDVVEDVKNTTEYLTPDLSGGITYYFAVTAYDQLGNESGFSNETTVDIPLGDITPPQIYAVEIRDSSLVNLVFSEPVEKSSAENVDNYSIDHGIVIFSVVLDENDQMVNIRTSPHEKGVLYSMTINNVMDRADNPNMIEANSICTYRYNPEDHVPPTLVSAEAIDATHVDIIFSEDVDRTTAENISNFSIDKGISVVRASLDDDLRVVHLTTTAHQNSTKYSVVVNNVKDRAPTQNIIASNSQLSYSYYEEDRTPPKIYSAVIRAATKVDIVFTELIDQSTAEDLNNYKIDNSVNVLAAQLDNNLQIVHLTTSEHDAGVTYTITVNNIQDRAHPANTITANSQFTYTYTPEDIVPPTIVLADIVDATHLDITFSEDIERESAENSGNYNINNGISVINAELDNNQRVVHLTTTSHEGGVTYLLTVNNINDRAPNPNMILQNSTAAYTYVVEDHNPPMISNVVAMNETTIEISFNKILDRESAETRENYQINGGIEIYSAKLYADLKTVLLLTSAHNRSNVYVLTVNNVKDRAYPANIISTNSTFSYSLDAGTQPGGAIASNFNISGYNTAYLQAGDTYYLDRSYTLISVPEEFKDVLWIKTANNDRSSTDENFLQFDLQVDATVYIAYDKRAKQLPSWLEADFVSTGKKIKVSEYAENLIVFTKEFNKGQVILGGNMAAGAKGAESMYVVMVKPKQQQGPPRPDDTDDPQSLGPTNVFLLYQNYPNPFNAGTEIRFQLPENCFVTLTIYNILGQTVKRLVDGERQASHYIIHWDGRNGEGNMLPSGVYFSRLQVIRKTTVNGRRTNQVVYNDVRKMIYLK